ncbi:HEAT repeat domain-containing protein [Cyclobacterium jeungdonense]|uniref:HEAT repeat domain-containing protein n=1 Tax=Cyclobacterium jeungdonense TaxID=708087 RepID=A0ABT8CE21_9BACT|nr:HEAT repeat domain-containing protein [Cyclobacterium jeungdonense]MDN3690312.1 HEAT repeat domain-containing protein [Cyclobacterium jeungdonense]
MLKKIQLTNRPILFIQLFILVILFRCSEKRQEPVTIELTQEEVNDQAQAVLDLVKPQTHADLKLDIWAVDSLVADPISMQIDDLGRVYYSKTNRRKISEFDIRSHQDWEISSIKMKHVDDRRAFIHQELAPENSSENEWLPDINQDGSHDWKDLTVEKENVFRLEDTDADGRADRSQLIVSDFNEEISDVAGAVLYHEEELFVGVAPDLWKLRDTNGDGTMDEKESLAHGFGVHIGFGGHNMSGLKVGPEGKIYWGIGDIGFNGVDKEGNEYVYPNCGVIARANPDGTDFEIFAYGVRNTHEFDFDEYGNLISVDNDGDHRGERERIVYLVEGSDTGWRINWQFGKYRDPKNNSYKVWMDENMHLPRSEEQAAYFIPTIANYINGPTGMVYNPGTALGQQWKNKFFVAEFAGNPARSGIHAFSLKPKGAGFEMGESEQLVGGILATGMDFGPDGSLYFSDWIDGWVNKGYGRIWKLTDVTASADPLKMTASYLAADYSELKLEELAQLLEYEDQRVRQKAQFELAKRGESGLQVFHKKLKNGTDQLSRVHSIWGISQFARKDAETAALLLPFLLDSDDEIRAQAAKWLGDVRYVPAGEHLVPLLTDNHPRVRFFAAEAIGRIGYEAGKEELVNLLVQNDDKDVYIRHAASLALSRVASPEFLVSLADHSTDAVRLGAVLALRRLRHEGITEFLMDDSEYIVAEAARAINDDFSIPEAFPALGSLLTKRNFDSEPLLRRSINANLRWGTDEALANLLTYINRSDAPDAMRMEAIATVSNWASPSVLDRVDGWYRGEVQRDLADLKASSFETLMAVATSESSEIREAAVKALGDLTIDQSSEILLNLLNSDPIATVREASLRALAKMEQAPIDEAIEKALADQEKTVRVAGLDLIAQLEIDDETKASLLEEVIQKRTVEEQQAAVTTLAKLNENASLPVLERLLDQLENGTLPPSIELEFFEAMESMKAGSLLSRYEKIKSEMTEDDLLASYSGSMYGGDEAKGRRIFFQHATGQCIKCHAYDDFGGNAGPKLNGIGKKLSRKQLLEALIAPSERLAPGFGVVTLTLETEKTLAGIKVDENDTSITLEMGNQPDTVIQKSHITERRDAPSSMPDMKEYLTRREIRDLVSFLATLEEPFN